MAKTDSRFAPDTLTDDCVMELKSGGMRLEGRSGAREFYETFIFPWDPARHRFRGETVYSIRRTD